MKAVVRKTAMVQHRPAPRGNERRLVTQHPRRRILSLAAGAAALPAISRIAWGQSYPARSVRLVVGFPAGGAADIGARLIAQWLSERLGQQFFIENRPGAGSNIATEAVARAPADGYTLLWTTSANAVNATLYDKLNFDFIRDVTPVASVMRLPLVMLVHPSFPAGSVPEFIAYAKANPGKVNMASPGTGTAIHLSSELFKMMTDIDMVHVPYRDLPLLRSDRRKGRSLFRRVAFSDRVYQKR
jgi:tripartite-type tricarboxylate transporter receptor subunit TctC